MGVAKWKARGYVSPVVVESAAGLLRFRGGVPAADRRGGLAFSFLLTVHLLDGTRCGGIGLGLPDPISL